MKKKFYFIFFILLFIIILLSCLSTDSFCADPKIITKLNSAFIKIKDWIIKLSTPAAAVAVGTGVFMKKFSFGDEERIRTGKKLIRGSLYSYGFILATDLILAAIKSLVG
ncbi:MAG TPA: pilin [Clostridiaceae bacterium]|nr:pilin [Clostridiaceae bacterium]